MTDTDEKAVHIIGGGLAGSEAAWQLAERGVPVRLYEMRPAHNTPAHRTGYLAELVCSNSLKSLVLPSAAAALKHELALMGSFLLKEALHNRVPAGMALAVEREAFARAVSQKIAAHPGIQLVHEEITSLAPLLAAASTQQIIVATGPLSSDALAEDIARMLGREHLAFFDAAAPIVEAESLDRQKLVSQSRFDKGEGAYLNALLDKEQYLALVASLVRAERVTLRSFEKRELFSACQPIEEVARSGVDALRYGALKPIGLTDPTTGKRPYAAIQLRAENTRQSAWNLVGFQTNLSFAAQEEVIRRIPGFEQVSFVRYGVMHRNTFLNSPEVLGSGFELPSEPRLRFAGQITGTEGYTEAIASGLFAALNAYAALRERSAPVLPDTSTFGALVAYATTGETRHYQPLHVNYGLMPPLSQKPRGKRERYAAYAERAIAATRAMREANSQLDFLPAYELPHFDHLRQER
ncbi:MAG: methylenetetrahydrofolate--tRNA-(uracil(54)-C(5))-methyltransferase (FADH(2)-oxidizing) TrmFO [Coriobacteriales bacterium]|jgi:methylenetetrahydrofolate--tRNA-(uracil-5-)-methyltransferase|nr:methylenetetrahydrofolate--tRNA-(uracil(54)-C(5))-methyltransferase (FADH(2)-oxidizing) TrmFO [Coriobacteriales bacterium]